MAVSIDTERLEALARAALAEGSEDAALKIVAPAAALTGDARLWQFTGLLQRALDEHVEALRSLAAAARLAPNDPTIAHARARVALEAGLDAVALFEQAMQLAPTSGEVMLGLTAAKFAAGQTTEAETELDAALVRSPLWVQGHMQLAQLRSMLGKRDEAGSSIERALPQHPREPGLWTALFNLALAAMDFTGLVRAAERARKAGMPEAQIAPFEAIAVSEQGETERADRLFKTMEPAFRKPIEVWHVRHLLRSGRVDQAVELIDRELQSETTNEFWPYASIAWRMAGDPRWEWLYCRGTLVSTFDLADALPPLPELAAKLRSLHVANAEYLDQSVRGGTQTDGPLFSRLEPEIQTLRTAIVGAVEQYLAQLPPPDPEHPLLKERRDRRVRFAGSWSVRLRGAGHHVSHVHPQGWISSALYIALPKTRRSDDPHSGWLKIGEPPPELGLELPAVGHIEPKPGHLVLFPSWMWHGTVPFENGERLTVAFDVQRPFRHSHS